MKLLASLVVCFAITIFGGCAKSHLRPLSTEPVRLTDIVNDVEVNGNRSKYNGQKVTFTAAGTIYPTADGDPPRLELFTHHDKVRFFITDSDAKFGHDHYYMNYMQSNLAHIRGNTTYTFTLLIKDIVEDTTTQGDPFFTIWSDVPEHTAKADIEVIDTTLEQIVASGQNYAAKTVRLQATVSLDRLNELLNIRDGVDPEVIKNYVGAMTLATNNRDVTFWVIDDVATGDALPSNLEKYRNHQTYTFTLYIQRIVIEGEQVEVTTGIADD